MFSVLDDYFHISREIDFRDLIEREPGEALESLVRQLGAMLKLEPEWSGRGADEGRDLVFVEKRKGPLGEDRIKWLVQCKDHAKSGKSVREAEIGSITDRVRQHKADGYLLATTTIPSAGLKKRLDALDIRNGGEFRTWVWDNSELKKLLLMEDAMPIVAAHFPRRMKPEGERFLHGLTGSVVGLRDNLRLLERFETSRGSVGDPTYAKLIELSCAIVDELLIQIRALSPVPRSGYLPCTMDAAFLQRLMNQAQSLALVHGSPPVEFAVESNLKKQPLSVDVPASVLERVVLEIISNAIRYRTPDERPSIGISVDEDAGAVRIDIVDRGIGIAPEDADRIFQPGYRGPAAQRLSVRGSGLGLGLSRSVLRQYQGDLALHAKGPPTRFTITLKKARAK